MKELKEGDYVIITKPSINIFNVKAQIIEVVNRASDDTFYYYLVKYNDNQVHYETTQIFDEAYSLSQETIEIDIEYSRDLKLKQLGI
jgi:hypothetical protein